MQAIKETLSTGIVNWLFNVPHTLPVQKTPQVVRTPEQVQDLRHAGNLRPTNRKVTEFVLGTYTPEKMADKAFALAIDLERAKAAGDSDEVTRLDKLGQHYEVIGEAKELIEPGFQEKVIALVQVKADALARTRKGNLNPPVRARGIDGLSTVAPDAPEVPVEHPIESHDLQEAFEHIQDPALINALQELGKLGQGPQSTI